MEIVIAFFIVFFVLVFRRFRRQEARTTILTGTGSELIVQLETKLNRALVQYEKIDALQDTLRPTMSPEGRALADTSHMTRVNTELDLFERIDGLKAIIAVYGPTLAYAYFRGEWVVAADIDQRKLSFRQRNQINCAIQRSH